MMWGAVLATAEPGGWPERGVCIHACSQQLFQRPSFGVEARSGAAAGGHSVTETEEPETVKAEMTRQSSLCKEQGRPRCMALGFWTL